MKGIIGLLLAAVALIYARQGAAWAAEGIHTVKIGDVEISTLSEGAGEGKSSLFVGATEEQIKKYVPTGNYATEVNAFLIRSPEYVVLVDTGFGRKLFDNMKALGVEPEQIDAVLLTHMHGDHIGGLLKDGKPAFPKARVYVSQQESDYWTSDAIAAQLPEDKRGGFQKVKETLAAYGDAVETFQPNLLGALFEELLPGIKPIAAFGHTPGHTLYLVEPEASEQRLLIWGDLTHAMAIQINVPEVAMVYDVNPEEAVASRKAVFKYIAEAKIPVAGMHIPYPAMGTVEKNAGERYDFSQMK